MSNDTEKKHIYISADYDETDGDRDVVDELKRWNDNGNYKLDFTDMAKVASGSIAKDSDCRICDLKEEFNRQINKSSIVIFIIGNKTGRRTAGSECSRIDIDWMNCMCTPYKQNTNGEKMCKVRDTTGASQDVGYINKYSYLRHEFEEAYKKGKKTIFVYNSLIRQPSWIPSYMKKRVNENDIEPFWTKDSYGNKKGDYQKIKEALGLDEQ